MLVKEYREKFNKLSIEKALIKNQIKSKNTNLLTLKNKYNNLLEAQEIILKVAKLTQEEIKFYITDLVNLALKSIPFEETDIVFDIDFVTRRNQQEADLVIIENDKKFNPISSYGGGINEILSLALRIACYSLYYGKKNNTLIFDEGLKFLSVNLRKYAGVMLKELSEKLNLQIIFITHQGEYLEFADKIIHIKKVNKESKIF
jgi:DNA repair exonuclease SbcCD ATPase subunit